MVAPMARRAIMVGWMDCKILHRKAAEFSIKIVLFISTYIQLEESNSYFAFPTGT